MGVVDCILVLVIALAVFGGLRQGFLRSFSALAGLFLGLLLAAWNYPLAAALVQPVVHFEAAANTIGFLAIALLVMALAGFAGNLLSQTVHRIGLGCLDRLAGAAFGFLQGALLVTLVVWVAVAFFPHAGWLTSARLPRAFFGTCHLSTHVSPQELADRVRQGLKELEAQSPQWLHPNRSTL
jgi:membrane protein required for colicin V production